MTSTIDIRTQKARRLISDMWNNYNADHDIGGDFNWVDGKILHLVEDLVEVIEMQSRRIDELENGYQR